MAFRVVCISRSIAAGGDAVGRAVATSLGYRYVDEEIITTAALKAQVDPTVVAASEHRQPLLQRLLDAMPSTLDLAGTLVLGAGVPLGAEAEVTRTKPEDMRTFIRAAIYEVGRAGRAVIVAHAGSLALAGVEGVLRVLVTASPATRAERLAAEQNIGAAEATAAVAASDRERREYFRRFYKIKDELPVHYDLIVNTDQVTPEHAATIVVTAVRSSS